MCERTSGTPHRPRHRFRLALTTLLTIVVAVPLTAQTIDEESSLGSAAADPLPHATATPTWRGALEDSFRLLMLEHGARVVFQPKTRRELDGPFVADYTRSLKWPTTWNDGDGWGVNYIGHPIHGAAAGFIWVDHERGARDPSLGFTKGYWASRARASAWAAAYSIQFEFGPMSEASIGNVGLHPNTTGWVDHVITPTGAFGFMVAEDFVDRVLIRRIETWTSNRLLTSLSRVALNPSRALSNAAQGRAPWSRIRPTGR